MFLHDTEWENTGSNTLIQFGNPYINLLYLKMIFLETMIVKTQYSMLELKNKHSCSRICMHQIFVEFQ